MWQYHGRRQAADAGPGRRCRLDAGRNRRQGFHRRAPRRLGNRRRGRSRQPAVVFLRRWIKLPRKVGFRAVMARMDDGHDFRGWDLCIAERPPGRTPDQSLARQRHQDRFADRASAGQWHHVMVTYDGSRQAAGAKIYIDGKPQPVVRRSRQPQGHDADARCR